MYVTTGGPGGGGGGGRIPSTQSRSWGLIGQALICNIKLVYKVGVVWAESYKTRLRVVIKQDLIEFKINHEDIILFNKEEETYNQP